MKAIKLPRLPDWMTPLALFGVVVLAYGIYIPWMGLYGDDWIFLWVQKVFGPLGYPSFFASDRPFESWLLVISTFFTRDHIWVYHALAVLLRGLDVIALWWLLKVIWPNHSRQALWVALLFAVYPGFVQQFIPLEFLIHYFALGTFLLSIGLMILAVRNPQRAVPWMILALLCSAGMFTIEYFVGLELLRPVILWFVLAGDNLDLKKRIGRLLKYWLPFMVVLAVYIFWRVFIFGFHFYHPSLLQNIIANPWKTLLSFGEKTLVDGFKAMILAWLQIFNLPMGLRALILYLAIVGVGAVATGLIIFKLPEGKMIATDAKFSTRLTWVKQAGLVCLVSFLVAGIPILIVEIPLEVYFPWDRGTLAYMLAASLLLVALLELIPPNISRYVLVLLLCLSLGYSAKNARAYINEVSSQRQLIWQLLWRAPQIKQGTLLLFDNLSLLHMTDNDISPLVDWSYAPDVTGNPIPYRLFSLFDEPQRQDAFSTPDQTINDTYRNFTFVGSTANLVLFSYQSPGCVRVLRPQDDYAVDATPEVTKVRHLSNPDLILTSADGPVHPPLYLDQEPTHTWCYYFEKADLARQQKDWAQVAALWNQAAGKSLSPGTIYEYAPFIEAFARLNNWDMARGLSLQAKGIAQDFSRQGTVEEICQMWNQLAQGLPSSAQNPARLGEIKQSLGCQAP